MVKKAQSVRIIDVLILGPFMIWFGIIAEAVPLWAKIVMIFSGIMTILYNAKNWLALEGYISKKWDF